MLFKTDVQVPPPGFSLSLQRELLFLGSCFAEHIGERLIHSKFHCRVNPWGVLYNPVSIADWIRRAADTSLAAPEPAWPLFESGGLHHCWWADSGLSAPTVEECRRKVSEEWQAVRTAWGRTQALVITLGTNRCYCLSDGGDVVANCHKQPVAAFEEVRLSPQEIVETLGNALDALWSTAPHVQVIFTISPYRYAKYGFHESQLGKAALLWAVDELCRSRLHCTYFPAYEILLDELRDYRFYAEDMLHPSTQAVDYICKRFMDAYLDDEARTFLNRWKPLARALHHRPLHPEGSEYVRFLRTTQQRLTELQCAYPAVDFTVEQMQLTQQIAKLSLS